MAERATQRSGAARTVLIVLAAVALGVAGCTRKSDRLLFNGAYYPVKARTVDKGERTRFSVSVRRADQGLAGAREAGRHGGKQYCLEKFGTSEIEWTLGPDATDAALTGGGSGMVMTGKCVIW